MRILAVAGCLASARSQLALGATPRKFTWHGTALGARSSLTLFHVSDIEGVRLVKRVAAELARLEKLFSLYQADSALVLLNQRGHIGFPPLDMVRLLSEARSMSEVTEGSFDVTVQPLWEFYAAHYRYGGNDTRRPTQDTIDAVLDRVGYQFVEVDSTAIRLTRPNMSITLNGIAQGYITDRIADLLRAEGLRHVLVDLGEIRALDSHPSGRPWQIGLQDPDAAGRIQREIGIEGQAVATSAGSGARIDPRGVFHHIFNPGSGRSSIIYKSITVIGERATVADALSTGLYNMPPERARATLAGFPGYIAYVVYANGSWEKWRG